MRPMWLYTGDNDDCRTAASSAQGWAGTTGRGRPLQTMFKGRTDARSEVVGLDSGSADQHVLEVKEPGMEEPLAGRWRMKKSKGNFVYSHELKTKRRRIERKIRRNT